MARHHLLLVEDEPSIRDPLATYLVRQGFRVTAVGDAAKARSALIAYQIHLVLLDIMMPGEDGLSLCRYLAATDGPPVILVSAKGEEMDRIVGLEIGAADYVTKPFSPRELAARVRAVLKRSPASMALAAADGKATRYVFEGWMLDTESQLLHDPQGAVIELSSGEFRLLEILVQRSGSALSRDQLLDLTQGREAGPFDRSIDNAISRLRKKIEADATRPEFIKTVWGSGYRFSAKVTQL